MPVVPPAGGRAPHSQHSHSDNQGDAEVREVHHPVHEVQVHRPAPLPAPMDPSQLMMSQVLMQLWESRQDAQQPLASISCLPELLGQQLAARQGAGALQEAPDHEQVRRLRHRLQDGRRAILRRCRGWAAAVLGLPVACIRVAALHAAMTTQSLRSSSCGQPATGHAPGGHVTPLLRNSNWDAQWPAGCKAAA